MTKIFPLPEIVLTIFSLFAHNYFTATQGSIGQKKIEVVLLIHIFFGWQIF
jgi:hypothetical protein